MKLLNIFLSVAQVEKIISSDPAAVNANMMGKNALHFAAQHPRDRQQKLAILIDNGVDVNAKEYTSTEHNTPLHTLIANEEHADAVFFIKKATKKLNYAVQDKEGKTPLIIAAKINSTSIALELLAQIGKNPQILDKQDEQGMTALHYASLYGNKELALALIKAGASTTILNNDNKTPIDCSALGEMEIKKALSSVSIDPERDEKARFDCFKDKLSQPLQVYLNPQQMGNTIIIPVLKENSAQLMNALKMRLVDTSKLTREIVERFFPMQQEDKEWIANQLNPLTGKSLSTALKENAIELKNYYIMNGFFSGWLLRSEAAKGNLSTVKALLARNLSKIDSCGLKDNRTALHYAAYNNHAAVVDFLLDNKANINCQEISAGETPLHLAIQKKHFDLAKKLVSRGASLAIKNKAGDNALNLLTKLNQPQLKEELIKINQQTGISILEDCLSQLAFK